MFFVSPRAEGERSALHLRRPPPPAVGGIDGALPDSGQFGTNSATPPCPESRVGCPESARSCPESAGSCPEFTRSCPESGLACPESAGACPDIGEKASRNRQFCRCVKRTGADGT